MEEKFRRIIELFQKDFHSKNYFTSDTADDFTCPFIQECEVLKGKEPIYTSYFGEEKSKVMIVAEAPSSSGGIGIFISKNFNEIITNSKSPLYLIKKFVKEQYNEIPYFTDLIKCGVAKQKEKKILRKRAEICIKKYLVEEIKIIQPELIICVGSLAYEYILNSQKESIISPNIKVVKIIHYSHQAGLPLNDEDKELIWKIQTGLIKADDIPLQQLSFFNKF
jgi:uracil-DNA glycosylase family 4